MNTSRIDFDFEEYRAEDTSSLINLYKDCFDTDPGTEYFKWKYLDNPAGPVEATIALHEGRIAGFWGLIPEVYLVNGERFTFYQSMDVMAHSNYRRMGLFSSLGMLTQKRLIEKQGCVYLFAYPGITAYRGFTDKLGWTLGLNVNLKFVHRNIFRLRTTLKKEVRLEPEYVSEFDEHFNSYFSERQGTEKKISRLIDKPFLEWRFFRNPTRDYKVLKFTEDGSIAGLVIYTLDERNRCFIQFVDCLYRKRTTDILRAFCNHIFQFKDVSFVFTFATTENELKSGLAKNGFIHNPFSKGPFSYRPAFVHYSNCPNIDGIDFYDMENYAISPVQRDY